MARSSCTRTLGFSRVLSLGVRGCSIGGAITSLLYNSASPPINTEKVELLWMTVSGLVLSFALDEATVHAFSLRTWQLANENTSPPWGARPQSICEEGAVETEGCL